LGTFNTAMEIVQNNRVQPGMLVNKGHGQINPG